MTARAERSGDRRASRPERGHAIVPHTADAGLRVVSRTLEGLFEEAASALAELTADVLPGTGASAWEPVGIEAGDLAGLAFGWLNELIALGELHRGVVVDARVERIVEPTMPTPGGPWRLDGRVGLAPFSGGGVRLRRSVKSATYHRLAVTRRREGWTMLAYLDI